MAKKAIKPNIVRGGIGIPVPGKTNYYYMKGRKHKDGGIDIGSNPRTGLEVEDGEVIHLTDNNIKVFSSVPFLNGQSPAEKVMGGENPNKVFKQQENFKDRNKLNDDGTKKARLGKKAPVVRTPEDEKVSKLIRSYYKEVNPLAGYPSVGDAIAHGMNVFGRRYVETDSTAYPVTDKVADATWRKRLGLSYNENDLPSNSDGSVRLPKDRELEIPIDTNLLKRRINANLKLSDKYKKQGDSTKQSIIDWAIKEDQKGLDSLRHTYKTGEPVVINEQVYNTRSLINNGKISMPGSSPLNPLQNYTLQYDKDKNIIRYRDVYDFNHLDWAVPGKGYEIKGEIDLNKKAMGGDNKIDPTHENKRSVIDNTLQKRDEYINNFKSTFPNKNIDKQKLDNIAITVLNRKLGLDNRESDKKEILNWYTKRASSRPDLISQEQLKDVKYLIDNIGIKNASTINTPQSLDTKNVITGIPSIQSQFLKENPSTGGVYSPQSHMVIINDHNNATWQHNPDYPSQTVYQHEIEHGVPTFLPQVESIMQKHGIKPDGYTNNPDEMKSRLRQVRTLHNIDPSKYYNLDEIRELRKDNTDFNTGLDILNNKSYSDEFVLDLFNQVALNKTDNTNIVNYALYGGNFKKDIIKNSKYKQNIPLDIFRFVGTTKDNARFNMNYNKLYNKKAMVEKLNKPVTVTVNGKTKVVYSPSTGGTRSEAEGNRIKGKLGLITKIGNFIGNNKNLVNDGLSLVGNITGSLLSNRANRKMLNSLEYGPAPISLQPTKLKTRININSQLDKMRETLERYNSNVDANTASSRVALARKNRAADKILEQYNSLLGDKENKETQLINQDRLNRQDITNQNIANYNTYLTNKANFENKVRELKGENKVNLINNINSAIQNTISTGEKRRRDRNSLIAIIAANPNVNPQMLKDLGFDGLTQKDIDLINKHRKVNK